MIPIYVGSILRKLGNLNEMILNIVVNDRIVVGKSFYKFKGTRIPIHILVIKLYIYSFFWFSYFRISLKRMNELLFLFARQSIFRKPCLRCFYKEDIFECLQRNLVFTNCFIFTMLRKFTCSALDNWIII